jgi:hypothetical protein
MVTVIDYIVEILQLSKHTILFSGLCDVQYVDISQGPLNPMNKTLKLV